MRRAEATMVLNETSVLEKEIGELRNRRKQLYADIENLPKEKHRLTEELKVISQQKKEIELYISDQKEVKIKEKLESDVKALQVKINALEDRYSFLLLKKNKLQSEIKSNIDLIEEREQLKGEIDALIEQKEILKSDVNLPKISDVKQELEKLEREYSTLLLKKNRLRTEIN